MTNERLRAPVLLSAITAHLVAAPLQCQAATSQELSLNISAEIAAARTLCGDPEEFGISASAKGKADATPSKLIKSLAKFGITLNSNINTTYGILQSDVAKDRADVRACKTHIFVTLHKASKATTETLTYGQKSPRQSKTGTPRNAEINNFNYMDNDIKYNNLDSKKNTSILENTPTPSPTSNLNPTSTESGNFYNNPRIRITGHSNISHNGGAGIASCNSDVEIDGDVNITDNAGKGIDAAACQDRKPDGPKP